MIAYAITDKSNFSFSKIKDDLKRISKKANFILYRDKTNPNYKNNAKKFVKIAKEFDFEKIFIQNDIDLALELGVSIHFSSSNISKIEKAKAFDLFVIASCHNKEEIKLASKADMITLSPLFKTPNKGTPLGKERFKELISFSKVPVIALGGIVSKEQINFALDLGAVGFASIRYFAK
jgi:thiamine-phosphate pyrophosphorylase